VNRRLTWRQIEAITGMTRPRAAQADGDAVLLADEDPRIDVACHSAARLIQSGQVKSIPSAIAGMLARLLTLRSVTNPDFVESRYHARLARVIVGQHLSLRTSTLSIMRP